jgi:hypothetical protein
VVGQSLSPSMQELQTSFHSNYHNFCSMPTSNQVSDHSKENSHMKRNFCIFYFHIFLKPTHTQQWTFNNKKNSCLSQPLFTSTTYIR